MSLLTLMRKSFSYEKFSFLKDLGLQKENYGAYFDGKWQGNG